MTKKETANPLAEQLAGIFAAKGATQQPHQRLERAKKATGQADFKLESAVRGYNNARVQLIVNHIKSSGQNWCQYGQHLAEGAVKVCVSSGKHWTGSGYYEGIESFSNSYSICDGCWGSLSPRSVGDSETYTNRSVINADGEQLWIDEFHRHLPWKMKEIMASWDIPPAIDINYASLGPWASKYTIDGKDLFANEAEAK